MKIKDDDQTARQPEGCFSDQTNQWQKIDKSKLVLDDSDRLGSGGFGAVYSASLSLAKVAVKRYDELLGDDLASESVRSATEGAQR
eukprot:3979301-Amphidinium_carterae.1